MRQGVRERERMQEKERERKKERKREGDRVPAMPRTESAFKLEMTDHILWTPLDFLPKRGLIDSQCKTRRQPRPCQSPDILALLHPSIVESAI